MQHYPEAYIDYLVYFHTDRDLFECHEVLEEYWKSVPDSPLRQAWQGLIQMAVGLYHQRRGNVAGAQKMLGSAISNLSESHLQQLGFETAAFLELIKIRIEQLSEKPERSYTDLNMPFADTQLQQVCMKRAASANKKWLDVSDLTDPNLIHKHTLRDRSEVVRERQKQLNLKQYKRV